VEQEQDPNFTLKSVVMCLVTKKDNNLRSKLNGGISVDQYHTSQNDTSQNVVSGKAENAFDSHKEAVEQANLVDIAIERTRQMAQMVADLTAIVLVTLGSEGEKKLTLCWSSVGGRLEMMRMVASTLTSFNPNLSEMFEKEVRLTPRSWFSIIMSYIRIVFFSLFKLILSVPYPKFCQGRGIKCEPVRTKTMHNVALLFSSVIKIGKMFIRIVVSTPSDHIYSIIQHNSMTTIHWRSESLFLRWSVARVKYIKSLMFPLCRLTLSLVCPIILDAKERFGKVLLKGNGRKNLTLLWSSVIRMGRMYVWIVLCSSSNPTYSLICPNVSELLQKDFQLLLLPFCSVIMKFIRIVFSRHNRIRDPPLALTCPTRCNQETALVAFNSGENHKASFSDICMDRKCQCGCEFDFCISLRYEEDYLSEIETDVETDEILFYHENVGSRVFEIALDPHQAALLQALQVDFVIQRTQRMIQIASKLSPLEECQIVPDTTCEIALGQALQVDLLLKQTQQMVETVANLPTLQKAHKAKTNPMKNKNVYHLTLPWSSVTRMARMCVWISASSILLGSLAFSNISETWQKEFQSTLLPLSFVILWYINVAMFSPSNLLLSPPLSPTFCNQGKTVYDSTSARNGSEMTGFDLFSRNVAFRIKSP